MPHGQSPSSKAGGIPLLIPLDNLILSLTLKRLGIFSCTLPLGNRSVHLEDRAREIERLLDGPDFLMLARRKGLSRISHCHPANRDH